jgi:hypothetical protein
VLTLEASERPQCYEKSWEHSTVILLDRLNERLACSLVAIANEQRRRQRQEEEGCARERRGPIALAGSRRISFPFQR